MWIVDFGLMPEEEARLFSVPWGYVNEHVRPIRATNNRAVYREKWWLHMEPRPAMRRALTGLPRFIATTRHSTHRTFSWLTPEVLPDSALIAIAADDDFTFGVLHSRLHEVWSLAMGSSLGVGNDPRYTPSTCFETFPFPEPSRATEDAIGAAAAHLDAVRRHLLDHDARLTVTKLYNDLAGLREHRDATARAFPLLLAHEALDAAVADAYGWEWPMTDNKILEQLLALNLTRSAGE